LAVAVFADPFDCGRVLPLLNLLDLINVMNFELSEFLLESLLVGQDAAPAADGAGGLSSLFGNNLSMLIPFLLIFVAFYFMILMPERKKRAEQEKLLGGLKKNDRIVTTGGIIGVVVMAEKGSKQVTIRIDEKTDAKMTLIRSAIAQVISDDADIDSKKAS
jgi:preprotein translocase subunit YajC